MELSWVMRQVDKLGINMIQAQFFGGTADMLPDPEDMYDPARYGSPGRRWAHRPGSGWGLRPAPGRWTPAAAVLIGCLDVPTSGTYHLGGVDVSTMDDDQQAEIRILQENGGGVGGKAVGGGAVDAHPVYPALKDFAGDGVTTSSRALWPSSMT